MILCKYIIVVKQINKADNKMSFEFVMMKIGHILIKLYETI